MDKLQLIKENSYLKFGIITLIEQIEDIKEYRELKKYLTSLILQEKIEEQPKKDIEKFFEQLKKGDDDLSNCG